MKTIVTPVNYTDDLERMMQEKKCDVVGIESMSVTYTQPADTCSSPNEIQCITITTQCGDSCTIEEAKNQEGCYFNISIPEGQHWSVEDGDSLKALIDDFKKRLYLVTDNKTTKSKSE